MYYACVFTYSIYIPESKKTFASSTAYPSSVEPRIPIAPLCLLVGIGVEWVGVDGWWSIELTLPHG